MQFACSTQKKYIYFYKCICDNILEGKGIYTLPLPVHELPSYVQKDSRIILFFSVFSLLPSANYNSTPF